MKQIMRFAMCVLTAGFINTGISAQNAYDAVFIPCFRLTLSTNKTTNLIFPYSITSYNIGSGDVTAQQAKGVKNILLLKASRNQFTETNVAVITADGKLYGFTVNYADQPNSLYVRFEKDSAHPAISVPGDIASGSNEATIETNAATVSNLSRTVYGVRCRKNGMYLSMKGLYIKDDVIYCQLTLHNHTNIRYDVDMKNFLIRDKKVSKRTAVQDEPMAPLYVFGNTTVVPGKVNQTMVVALPKFTIPDKKIFIVELMEKNGGRHLTLKMSNSTLIKAMEL